MDVNSTLIALNTEKSRLIGEIREHRNRIADIDKTIENIVKVSNFESCGRCNGRGMVFVKDPSGNGGTWDKCPDCCGAGYFERNKVKKS